ncbi:chondroitinase family polysaccharide lyase [Pedobacter arcticus]|uniref:chondroitinase family polysaccharide lyase n=1 Tax=Pedobacter arcticus TaxID=752140 RepID=UPI0003131983|nr:chondroitinase family polysaccharide lyase [Pedobacter arcticus]
MKKTIILLLIATLNFSVAKADDIDDISNKYMSWILGSAQIDYSNSLIKERYKAILGYVDKANKTYNRFNFDSTDAYVLTAKNGQEEVRDIFRNILFPLSLGYQLPGGPASPNPDYKNPNTLKKIISVFQYLHKKGWKKGLDMGYGKLDSYKETGVIGFGGSMGNNVLPYGLSVYLMKTELSAKGMFATEIEMLDWISNSAGTASDFPLLWEETGYNSDGVRAMFNTRLCYILSLPKDSPSRKTEMLFLQKLFNKALQISNGWADFIKSDYLGYHHKGAYLSAYAPGALHTASLMTYLLKGSSYEVGEKAIENLSKAILTTRIYSNKYDAPRASNGRFPTNLGDLLYNMPYFLYVANNDNPLQQELKSAFMRLWNPKENDFKSFLDDVTGGIMYHGSLGALELAINTTHQNIASEKAPNGYWYFPNGGLTIYRQHEWLVSWKGVSKYIWDYESGPGQNVYGRYASAGVLSILASGNPISTVASGYGIDGWNWTRLPGATTFDLPSEKVKTRKTRSFIPESYLGGANLNGSFGVSGMNYMDPFSSLKANKSVFFFDDHLVAIGSDITAINDEHLVQTTLAQLSITKENSISYFNDKKITSLNTKIKNDGGKVATYVDVMGHAYYIKTSDEILVERTTQTEPQQSGKKTASGDFETARIIHGTNPKSSSYQYVINVNGGIQGAKALKSNFSKLFKVVQQDSVAHIVSYLPKNITGYAIRKENTSLADGLVLSATKPCFAMVGQEKGNQMKLSVSNPELGRTTEFKPYNDIVSRELWHAKSTVQPVRLTLKGSWSIAPGSTPSDAKIISKGATTVIEFNCFDGKTIQVDLVKK